MKRSNLSHNAESPSTMPELPTSVEFLDRDTEASFIITLSSLPESTTALNHSDMCSCGCSMVKSKAIGGQESLAPSEPNPTTERAVINNGDKQHFVGMEPFNCTIFSYSSKKRGSLSSKIFKERSTI